MKKGSKAMGLDSWQGHELKNLPFVFWDNMAKLLDTIEEASCCRWPRALVTASITLLSEGEGLDVIKQNLSLSSHSSTGLTRASDTGVLKSGKIPGRHRKSLERYRIEMLLTRPGC